MNHTTVAVRRSALEGRAEVKGYASSLDGFPVVVHRPVLKDGAAGEGWSVTEPKSGCLIAWEPRGATRRDALSAARDIYDRNGGRKGMLEAIRRVTILG